MRDQHTDNMNKTAFPNTRSQVRHGRLGQRSSRSCSVTRGHIVISSNNYRSPIIFPVRRRPFGLLGGAYQPVMRGSGARRGGPEQCADQPTRRVTGGSERTQAAVQVWPVWAAIVQRSSWCANCQVEARVTYRRRRSDLCLTGILPSDVMFLTGSAGGLSACRTGEAPKPVPAAALISSPRAWWLLDEMAPRAVARCRRGRAADGRT